MAEEVNISVTDIRLLTTMMNTVFIIGQLERKSSLYLNLLYSIYTVTIYTRDINVCTENNSPLPPLLIISKEMH